MIWFLALLLVLVVGGVVVVAVGRGAALRDVYDDRPDALLPADTGLSGADLRAVRFSVGFRGYRMDEVDALLARLSEQLDQGRDDRAHHDRTHHDRTHHDRTHHDRTHHDQTNHDQALDDRERP